MNGLIYVALAYLFFGAGIGALIGKLTDPNFKVKVLRKILRKNYAILAIVSRDMKRIWRYTINLDSDIIKHGDNLWVVEKNRIYIQTPEKQVRTKQGFITDSALRWEEGVPVIYVCAESVKPLEFFKDELTVASSEISATLKGWLQTEIEKAKAKAQKYQTYTLINLILNLLCVAGLVLLYLKISSIPGVS